MMKQFNLTVKTKGRGMTNITEEINTFVNQSNIEIGLCNIFLQHTSASLTLCENADPIVLKDAEAFFARLIPDGDKIFRHTAEGPDDMSAHLRTMLTQNSLTIPIADKKLLLGTWQGIYLWEHRVNDFQRNMIITLFS